MKPKYIWCNGHNSYVGERKKRAPRVRCPKCNKMLTARTTDAEPYGSQFEPIYKIPPHKRRLKPNEQTYLKK